MKHKLGIIVVLLLVAPGLLAATSTFQYSGTTSANTGNAPTIAYGETYTLTFDIDLATPRLDKPISAETYHAVRSHIERDRYGVRRTADEGIAAGVLEGANPAQAYTTRFTPQGVLVRPRGTDIELGFTLTGWGYGTALSLVASAPPRAEGQRVEYVRGTLTEWYVNRRSGLEQGFTLNAPPQEERGEERLRLEMTLSGPLAAKASDGAIVFRDATGSTRLRYGGLKAWDATGRELAAEMTLTENRLTLEVDEAGAVYPVTVDPTIVNEDAKLLSSDGATGDRFGKSIAVSGNTAVVGANGDDNKGSAYVFDLSGATGTVTEIAKLLPSDGVAGDDFGWSVALSGNTAVVGARLDHAPDSDSGSAYVFDLSGATGTVTETAKLLPSDGDVGDNFGFSVAVSGNTAVVGAARDDDNGSDSGSAYVFDLSGATGTVNETAKLLPSDGAAGGNFGYYGVAVSGNTAVVGAWGSTSGSAYVFDLSGATGTVNETAKLLPSDVAAGDRFGWGVALSGNTAVVSATLDDDNGGNSGSAYVFDLSGATGTVNETAKLLPSDGADNDQFGTSVALSGNTAVVGTHGDTDNGSLSGSAYVFDLSGATGTVNEIVKLLPSDGAANDLFGDNLSVAVSGNTAVVGALNNDDNGTDSGSGYVFFNILPPPAVPMSSPWNLVALGAGLLLVLLVIVTRGRGWFVLGQVPGMKN